MWGFIDTLIINYINPININPINPIINTIAYMYNDDFIRLPFITHCVTYWSFAGLYALLDLYCTYNPDFMLKYKIQGDQMIKKIGGPIPDSTNLPNTPTIIPTIIPTNPKINWDLYANSALVALKNQGWFLLFLGIINPLMHWREISYDMELPVWYVQVAQIPVFYFILSTIFYYVHRILHLPYFYKRIHKIHHSWQTPIGCAAIYAHPIEHLFNNILPVFIPTLIMRIHPMYFNVIVFITTMNSVNVHSGYNFVNAQEHDDHHKHFLCNYGAGLDIFDWLHGTRYIDLKKAPTLSIQEDVPNE